MTYHAQAAGLALRVMPCALSIRSDPRLLEQMVRNLLSNALKYTQRGKVLVGCRRRKGKLRIEIWDTGIGIPTSELQAIFEEYRQLDNAARQRSQGLGLGLSIVKSLGELLGHRDPGALAGRKGLGVLDRGPAIAERRRVERLHIVASGADDASTHMAPRSGSILIIEDDPEVREHLELFLKEEGYDAATAVDGPAALELAVRRTVRPDLVLADYNLPNGMNGIQVCQKLRQELGRPIPFIILTGDISTEALRDIALHDCVQFNKPVTLRELTQAIEKLLAKPPAMHVALAAHPVEAAAVPDRAKIFVVDDDDQIREAIRAVLEDDGRVVETYASCEAFLEAFRPGHSACLLIDAYLPGMSGLELLRKLHDNGHRLPSIMITGNSDVPMAVEAMKAGALDFIEKPIGREELLVSIDRALELSQDFEQIARMAGVGGDPPRGSDAATARGDGQGARRRTQQEHCDRSGNQPTHGREPPRVDHEENRIEVSSRAGSAGARRSGRRERARTGSVTSTRFRLLAFRSPSWRAFALSFQPPAVPRRGTVQRAAIVGLDITFAETRHPAIGQHKPVAA